MFACSHVWLYVCMSCLSVWSYVCMAVCMYVCMYVCKYIRTYSRIFLCRNIFWILHSLCWTEPNHRHRRRHVTAAILQSLSVFLFCHSWLLQSAVCFQPQLGTCVCFDSARTVHGHSARARNAANTMENAPSIKTKKKQVSGYFFVISCNFLQMTCYLQHFLRVHCGYACMHCACTVKTCMFVCAFGMCVIRIFANLACKSTCMFSVCSVAACSHVRMYGCMYVRMYVCMYVCTYVGMYVCLSVCLYVCMYVCLFACMHV